MSFELFEFTQHVSLSSERYNFNLSIKADLKKSTFLAKKLVEFASVLTNSRRETYIGNFFIGGRRAYSDAVSYCLYQSWAPQAQVLGSRYLKDYILSSCFLPELSAQNLVLDLKYTKRTWPLFLSYTNLANSLIFLSKPSVFSQYYKQIMLMSAIFIEELWTNNISQNANDFTAII